MNTRVRPRSGVNSCVFFSVGFTAPTRSSCRPGVEALLGSSQLGSRPGNLVKFLPENLHF